MIQGIQYAFISTIIVLELNKLPSKAQARAIREEANMVPTATNLNIPRQELCVMLL